MARFFLTFVLTGLFFASDALAGQQVIFARDGSKVTVLMMAMTTNPDAIALNDALNVPVEEINGKWTKKISFMDDQGVVALDIVCAFSKLAGGTGSCVSVFKKSQGLEMEASRNRFIYRLSDAEAGRLAKLFVPSTGEIFRSQDGRFVIQSEVSVFRAEYR